MQRHHVLQVSTIPPASGITLCACGCGEPLVTKRAGWRFKPGHYRFIPNQHAVDPETGCWEWLGSITRRGHGIGRNDKGINEHAHALYWKALVGPVPKGYIVHHECDNKRCCNPDHLSLVSRGKHQSDHCEDKWRRQKADPSLRLIGRICTSGACAKANPPSPNGRNSGATFWGVTEQPSDRGAQGLQPEGRAPVAAGGGG